MHDIWWTALKGCRTVVEIGCGFGVVLKQMTERGYEAHGVDIFQPYLDYVNVVAPGATWECADGRAWCDTQADCSWDAVMMIDFIEHIPHDIGAETIEHAQRIAKHAVIMETPSGYMPQEAIEGFHIGTPGVPDMLNPHQKHVCGWEPAELEALGFRCVLQPGNRGYDRIYAAWNR